MLNKQELIEWIKENIDSTDIPNDEGNSDALIYNLVHLALDGKGYKKYKYLPEQDEEIESWHLFS